MVRDGVVNATNTNGIGAPIPNIPFNFYNLSARYFFPKSPLAKSHRVTVFGYYTFVDEFDLIFQVTRNEENIIPTQRQLDAGLTYQMGNSGLDISLEANNLLNAELFDNFRVPQKTQGAIFDKNPIPISTRF